MKRHKQFTPLVIIDRSAEKWAPYEHGHNYYEIIYIKEGSGIHHLNDSKLEYDKGDVFVLTPSDSHYFMIDVPTKFISVRFTDFKVQRGLNVSYNWSQEVNLLQSRVVRNSKVHFTEQDKLLTRHVFSILYSVRENILENESLIYLQVQSLLAIIKRSLPAAMEAKAIAAKAGQQSRLEQLISYIHEHITQPHQLHTSQLANNFCMPQTYVGAYFKRKMDITLKDYINQCRQTLIERRLRSGEYTMKEIVSEFGFTDESHLNKFFKKHRGVSPSEFRKQ
ncbi:helix-turn-helix domain-containing protein [Pontibacter harenae]|uniref:helix-turn-helix domain-containing protein n=1 Tax=Pontibacter harenae TaxID=2894083 RepID=UPI001E467B12|nr:AraC family transcriptional regulator [Pontibacter harenae]MCC9169073.1 AraC family transcriptional regulator [Pontibacter harenae]